MAYLAAAIINLAIIGLTGFVFHSTGSLWSFILLLFLVSVKDRKDVD